MTMMLADSDAGGVADMTWASTYVGTIPSPVVGGSRGSEDEDGDEEGVRAEDVEVEMSSQGSVRAGGSDAGDDHDHDPARETKIPLAHVRLMTALILLLRVASHYDGGVLAALYGDEDKTLETELGLTSTQQGLIVTLGYIGLICGCLVSGSIMNSVPSKRLVQASGVILMVGTALFAGAQGVWMIYIARLLVGFGQSLQTVLYPVWADEFAPTGGASGYLAALQAGGPLGIVFGYIITGLTMANTGLSWRWTWVFQGILMTLPMFIFLFIPLSYVECKHTRGGGGDGDGDNEAHDNGDSKNDPTAADDDDSEARTSRTLDASARRGLDSSHGSTEPIPPAVGVGRGAEGDVMSPTASSVSAADSIIRGSSKREVLLKIMQNGIIWCATMVLSSLYFVVNGMQTWVTDYITSPNSTIDASENTVIATFGITAATAPVSGIVVGGIVLAKLGGYRHYPSRTTLAGLAQGVCATICAYVTLVVDSFALFMTFIWLVLFFGGAMVPGMVGLIVTSVDKEHRSLVSAFASFFYNLLGYALGPLAAGVVADQFESDDIGIIWGFRVVMGWSAVALFLQLVVVILWRSKGVHEPRLDPDEVAALDAQRAVDAAAAAAEQHVAAAVDMNISCLPGESADEDEEGDVPNPLSPAADSECHPFSPEDVAMGRTPARTPGSGRRRVVVPTPPHMP